MDFHNRVAAFVLRGLYGVQCKLILRSDGSLATRSTLVRQLLGTIGVDCHADRVQVGLQKTCSVFTHFITDQHYSFGSGQIPV